MTAFRHRVRLWKNELVQRYFRYRIDSAAGPLRVKLRSHPYRLLLVLSHMRSGSSLLSHILSSNPAIIGYGETHINYHSPQDVRRLLQKVYWQAQEFRRFQDLRNLRMHHPYVMDKLLHDHKLADLQLLAQPHTYGIFLLREPSRSLASLLHLKPHWDAVAALSYYQQRLDTLAVYAQQLPPDHGLLITYEQLLQNTPASLALLQQFLQTPQPFTERYQLLKTTGKKGVGDSQGAIRAGQIVRQPRPLEIQIPAAVADAAKQSYQHCYDRLLACCRVLS